MLGIGGGMILGPLLLELGMIAETTAATSGMAVKGVEPPSDKGFKPTDIN